MSKSSIVRFAALSGFVIASSASVAWADPGARPAKPNALARANADVLRQLKPSGLKQHGANFSRLAGEGYHQFLVTIKAPSAKR